MTMQKAPDGSGDRGRYSSRPPKGEELDKVRRELGGG